MELLLCESPLSPIPEAVVAAKREVERSNR